MLKGSLRICSLLLVIAMAASVFAGCGAEKNTDQPSGSAISSSQEDTANVKPPEKIKLNFYAMNMNPKEMPDNDLVRSEIEKRIAEKINIEINVVETPINEYWNNLNTSIASGQQIDAFSEGVNQANNWGGKKDFIQNLKPLIDQYGQHLNEKVEKLAWDSVTFAGDTIAIPNHNLAILNCVIVRKDILDKYKIPMPTTLEEMEKACSDLLKIDPKMVPSVGVIGDMMAIVEPAMGIQFSASYVIDDANQKITYGSYTENYLPFLQFQKKWIDNGWYDRDYLVNQNKPEADTNAFASGKAAFLWRNIFMIKSMAVAAQKVDPKAEIAVITTFGPRNTGWSYSGPANMCVVVPKMCKAPERVVQFFDWMVADQANYDLVANGIEGTHFKYVDVDGQKKIQMLQTDDTKTYASLFLDGLTFDNLTLETYIDDPNNPNAKKNNDVYNDTIARLKATKWRTDPTLGKVSFDKAIEMKYPLLASLGTELSSKLTSGQIPLTKEGMKQVTDAYNKAGGEEVSKEYYRQYKAAGN